MIINDTLIDLIKEAIDISNYLRDQSKIELKKNSDFAPRDSNYLEMAIQIQRNKIMLEEFKMR